MSLDPRELRNAFGSFLTGVTIVTTVDETGTQTGFTANSFTSVSLDPPLLLVCLAKNADCYDAFMKCKGFAVNVLSEHQKELSNVFASKGIDKFSDAEMRREPVRHPVFHGDCAWFDCDVKQRLDGGDHTILIGRVMDFNYRKREPLGYLRGGYVSLGMERSAVTAWASADRLVAGAIIDRRREILLVEDEQTGVLAPPRIEAKPHANPVTQAENLLKALGLGEAQPFLFSVFEGAENSQHIYYRFLLSADEKASAGAFHPLSNLPWDRIKDEAVRFMLHRYRQERANQRFGVYLGDLEGGIVR